MAQVRVFLEDGVDQEGIHMTKVVRYLSTALPMTCEYPPGFSTRRHRLKTPKFLHLIHERGKAKERRKLQLDFPPSSLGIFSSLPPFSYSRHGGLR